MRCAVSHLIIKPQEDSGHKHMVTFSFNIDIQSMAQGVLGKKT